jgi:sterol desaturase/sphingolipid hydroxylase (fatty acid hydroxylase superfamily)
MESSSSSSPSLPQQLLSSILTAATTTNNQQSFTILSESFSTDSYIGIATIITIWLAHRHKQHGGKDIDPIKWTGIQLMLCLPAISAMVGGINYLAGSPYYDFNHKWMEFVATHSRKQLMRGAFIFFGTWYASFGLAVLALDMTKFPHFLYRLKTQPNAQIDYKKMLPRLFTMLAINLYLPFILYGILPRAMFESIETHVWEFASRYVRISPQLPSLLEFTKDIVGFFMIYDVGFFWSHWMLHLPFFYGRIHKLHHQWTAPTALAAAYAHPIEHIISNLSPAILAMLFFKPHYITFVAFTWLGLFTTLCEHSGYEFLADAKFHDIHHLRYNANFGLWGLYDDLMGTRMWPEEAYGTAVNRKKSM